MPVRPARPIRCSALARDTQPSMSLCAPLTGSHPSSLTRPESATKRMPSIVTADSAMFVAKTHLAELGREGSRV